MKLLNRSLLYLSGALFLALSVWAVIFYVSMLDEVRDSIDDGLDNSKLLVIHEAAKDSTLLVQKGFDEGNYSMLEIAPEKAKGHKDIYVDTLMYMENELDFEPVRLLTTAFQAKNGKFYELRVISSMVEEDDLIEDLLYSLLWLYLILIVSIFVINNIILRRLWQPFYNLLDKLRKFELGSKKVIEPEITTIDEFRNLNDALQEVLMNSMEVYESQKQLIENASHELQTPLAISLNKLQLFSEKHDLPQEQQEEIFQVIRSLERLTRLNKSLLLLSKIENRQFTEVSEIDINAIIRELKEDFEPIAEHKGIWIVLTENYELKLPGHADLMRILFTNLIKNAVVHNIPNGELRLIINADGVIIENTGAGESLDREKVFGRFYKGKHSVSSTGLGLAIVKSICDIEKIRISYEFDGVHRMVLKF